MLPCPEHRIAREEVLLDATMSRCIGQLERKFYWMLPCPDDRIAREEVLLDATMSR